MTPIANEFLGRLKSLFRKKRMDREMAEELEFHQALLREKLLREGVPATEVNAAARRVFGNQSRWQERLRELWQFRSLEQLLRDVRFSIRLLKKSPGFTTTALLTLALGVGANTAVFSLVNGLLLRPLPVPHSERLAVLSISMDGPRRQYTLPAPLFRDLETNHAIFSSTFAFSRKDMLVRGKFANEKMQGELVSGSYFEALETPPLLGRTLTPEDDRKGGNPAGLAVVISESFWENWFNRAPDVVGQKLTIANTIFTVVGVMPKRFIGAEPTERPDIFAPLADEPILDAPENMIEAGMHGWWLRVIGRLQPDLTLEQANAALLPVSMPILRNSGADPLQVTQMEKNHFRFFAEPGAQGFTYLRLFFKQPLMALFAMCGGILLLACMNLASLLMARSAARERELATRLAMGATRRRLIQQLLVESMLIALVGTGIGLALAPMVSQTIATSLLNNSERSVYLDTSIDVRVLAFSALAAGICTVLIGLIPALMATSGTLSEQIKDGQHATRAQERRRIFPKILLACEVSLALLLVVGAGLLGTSLFRLYNAKLGFDPRGVVNIELTMDKQALDGEPLQRVYRQIGEGLSREPGVQSVSFSRIIPLTGTSWDEDFHRAGGTARSLDLNAVGPNYFATMRTPMLLGRDFRWEDTMTSGLKMILNESAAQLLFPGQSPLGQHLLKEKSDYEVIAVVADAKYEDPHEVPPAAAFLPITQIDRKRPSYSAVVRIQGPKAPLAAAARALAAKLAPEIPVPAMTSMDKVLDDSLSSERVMAMLSLFFGGCALLVTAIGLYGTLSYATARRTSEIGIRMALGAQRASVVALIFRENAIIAIAGSVAGLVAAVLASKVLASFLYETSPRDPWVLIASVGALATIASTASLLPAIHAARIDPITAIRCD